MATQPRRHPRILVEIPIEIRAERVHKASARDLSEGGVRLRMDARVRVGDRVGVTLNVPKWAAINVAAEVRWVRPHESGVGCDAGLEFDHTPATQKHIASLLWELQTGDLASVSRRSRTRLPGKTA